MEMRFEWDPAKAASNLEKHDIDFLDAATVFDDPVRVEYPRQSRNMARFAPLLLA
jgi:uncharacterized DUF497 family protein